MRDLAAWVTWFVRDLQLAPPLPVIGFSLGGWIAAEIATVNAALFSKLVLVGAAGLKPEGGEVWDYFVHSNQDAFARAFHEPAQVRGVRAVLRQGLDAGGRAAGRAESRDGRAARLEAVHAQPHAGRVAGRGDHANPGDLGPRGRHHPRRRVRSVRARDPRGDGEGARGCGHMPEMEQPEAFVQAVLDFLRA